MKNKIRYALFVFLLALTACGAVEPTDPCGAEWTRYDVEPGACLAAWSAGYDWKEYAGRKSYTVPEAFVVHGIHVDQTLEPGVCHDVAQFGQFVHPSEAPLSVSLRVDAGTVETFAVGAPECDGMKAGFDSY